MDFIQREGLRVTLKRIGDKHTRRIGYLVGKNNVKNMET